MNALFLPEQMTEAERMQEIGRILAAGIERMHKKPNNYDDIENNSVDSAEEESVYA